MSPAAGEPARRWKRSVLVAGHRTSVSLEPEFWAELGRIAADRGLSINQLVSAIDGQGSGNLSSALRVYVLQTVRQKVPEAT